MTYTTRQRPICGDYQKRFQAAARVSWVTYEVWKAAMATEAFDPEGRLSVSIDMGEDLYEGG
jgi:hypothetical protein